MSDQTTSYETTHPLEYARQADANTLCFDRLEIEKTPGLKLKMPLLVDWHVRLRSHVRQYREIYDWNTSGDEFLRAMTTPPDSWVVTYQHGFVSADAVEASVIVAGPALLNILGDIEPFNLSDWTKHCHEDDLQPIIDANMFSHERHGPFDQAWRVMVNGQLKWVRASSQVVGEDSSGNRSHSGVIMDYTNFIPEDIQVVTIGHNDDDSTI